jgi:SAM-dependent methyltransferase
MNDSEAFKGYREAWERKPALRAVYGDMFDRIAAACGPGPTLEVGGGIGNLKGRVDGVISSDIQQGAYQDLVSDAQSLPFAPASLGNIVMLDVLHHLEFPTLFLAEATRVLRPRGRVVLIEPAITPGSTLFYRFLHQEPVDMSADPLVEGAPRPDRDPYESNQAIPTLLVTRDRERLRTRFPDLGLREVRWFAFFAYPLTGGFKPWTLLSEKMALRLLRWEKAFEEPFGRLLGFRMMIVLEKRAASS